MPAYRQRGDHRIRGGEASADRAVPAAAAEGGFTGLETAIVLIAFVVVSSVFAFVALTTGVFATDKAKGAIQSSLMSTRSSLEVHSVRGSATFTATTSQSIGTGDGSTTTFSMANFPVTPGSQTVRVGGATSTYGPGYVVKFDTGLVTFSSGPTSSAAITADYTYYKLDKITVSNATGGEAVDLTGGKTVVTYLDPDSASTNIINFSIVLLGSADSDNLLEPGELFEIQVDIGDYGLTDYDSFMLQIKPASGAVLAVGRTIPANLTAEMDLGQSYLPSRGPAPASDPGPARTR